jgi:hypothetical protein
MISGEIFSAPAPTGNPREDYQNLARWVEHVLREHFEDIKAISGSVDDRGFIIPAIYADADAPINTIYYSTDASKLAYKDAGGMVNALY